MTKTAPLSPLTYHRRISSPISVTNCDFHRWFIFGDRSNWPKLVSANLLKIPCLFETSFVMQFEKVIHARFVPYKSNLSQIYFFRNSRSKVPFSSAQIPLKLRMYQFLPVFYKNSYLKSDIFLENLWIFSNTRILKIFFWGFEETIYVKNWYFGLHSVRRAIWNNAIQSSAKLWDFWESV